MSTFAADILQAAGDEPIEAIVIGGYGWGGYSEPDDKIPSERRGRLLPWTEAEPLLNYEYSTGYGAPECHAITAWTKTKVLFVVQYDGSTSIEDVPRSPIDHQPNMPGG